MVERVTSNYVNDDGGSSASEEFFGILHFIYV
jgi:hypothetical protein